MSTCYLNFRQISKSKMELMMNGMRPMAQGSHKLFIDLLIVLSKVSLSLFDEIP